MTRFSINKNMQIRLACAGALLVTGLLGLSAGAQLGVVHFSAGEMKVAFGRGEQGLTMNIDARTCPPNCGFFEVNWAPLVR